MLQDMRDEWEMIFAWNGDEALQFLSGQPFDVIVTDMRLPSFDGTQLLNKVMELYPNTIRLILSGDSDQEMILKAAKSAHQLLAKPCDPRLLKCTINRAVKLRETLTNPNLRRLISGLNSLPSMPDIRNQIMQELRYANISIKRVGDLVALDVTMTAEVLKLVNSAFFGLPNRVTSPQQAVSLLGMDILQGLLFYVHIFSSCKINPRLNFSVQEVSEHSILVGNLAVEIVRSESLEKKAGEDALIAGMLHDIGKLVLAQLPDEYLKVKKYREEMRCPLVEAEYQVLGTSHAETGACLLGLWGNSDSIIETVAFHHRFHDLHEGGFSALSAVYTANTLVNFEKEFDEMTIPIIEEELAGITRTEHLPDWIESYRKMREKMIQSK